MRPLSLPIGWNVDRICPQCRRVTGAGICPRDGFPTVAADQYAAQHADRLIGQVFNERYRIEARVGRGGMGTVYQATQLSVNRPVAIKVLRSSDDQDLKDVARFQQEARAVASLRHPNTVRLIDYGQNLGGELYLVMEFLEGQTLAALMAEGPLEPGRVVDIGLQVAASLAEAHSQGIVHRDLKPANVILTDVVGRRGLVKVLDFGIAKVTGAASADTRLTHTGMSIGSPRYMAPEQAASHEISGQADLYALGVVMHEMLVGEPLFSKRNATEYLIAHMGEKPLYPSRDGRRLEGPLPALIMQCLAKSPGRRPAGAVELVARLEAARDGPVSVAADLPDLHEEATIALQEAVRDDQHVPTMDLEAALENHGPDVPQSRPTIELIAGGSVASAHSRGHVGTLPLQPSAPYAQAHSLSELQLVPGMYPRAPSPTDQQTDPDTTREDAVSGSGADVDRPAHGARRRWLSFAAGLVSVVALGLWLHSTGPGEGAAGTGTAESMSPVGHPASPTPDPDPDPALAFPTSPATVGSPTSVIDPGAGSVVILTDPPGAEVVLGDRVMGRTPASLTRAELREHGPAHIRLAGYRARTVADSQVGHRARMKIQLTPE